jgi:hypothetical protein
MCLSCWQWQSILKPFDSFLLGRRVKLPMVIFLIRWNYEFDEPGDNSCIIWCALLRRNRMTYGGTILRTKVRELYVFELSHRLSVIFAEYMVSLMSSKCDWTCCKIMGPRSSSRDLSSSHIARSAPQHNPSIQCFLQTQILCVGHLDPSNECPTWSCEAISKRLSCIEIDRACRPLLMRH